MLAAASVSESSPEPAVLVALPALAVALFAILQTGSLAEARRSERISARIAFAVACLLLVVAFAGAALEYFDRHDGVPTAVSAAAVGGLLLLTVLGHRFVHGLVAVAALAVVGLILLSIPGVKPMVFGTTKEPFLLRWNYAVTPAAATSPAAVEPREISLTFCESMAVLRSGRECAPGFPGAHEFQLTKLRHIDRAFAADTWIYEFSRESGDERFAYVTTTRQDPEWGLFVEGKDFRRNAVVGLTNFSSTPLVENVLEPMASEEGLVWATRGGIRTQIDPYSNTVGLVVMAFFLVATIVGLTLLVAWGLRRWRASPYGPASQ